MYYKKNIASYFVWILYLMVVGTAASFIGLVLTTTLGAENPLIALLMVVLFFGMMCLLYLASGVISSRLFAAREEPAKQKIWVEAVLVTVFLAVGLLFRVLMIDSAGEEAAYYAVAEATENSTGSFPFVQGSVCYYLSLLYGLFLLLGNHWMAGIWLQIALQFIGCVIAYFAVRKLAGSFPAVWTVGCIMLLPVSVQAGLTYSPKQMYFCLLAFGILLAAFLQRRCENEDAAVWSQWVLTVLNGLYIGFAIYSDVLGVLLLIPLFGILWMRRDLDSPGKRIGLFACAFGTAALFFFGLLFIDATVSNTSFMRVLGAWADTYAPEMISLDILLTETDRFYVALMVLAALGVFSFWRRRKEDVFCLWLLLMYAVLLLQLFGIVTVHENGSYVWFFSLSVLSGVSVRELFHVEAREKEEEQPEAVAAGREQKPAFAAASAVNPKQSARSSEKEKPVEKEKEPPKKEKPVKKEKEPPKKVNYIENPLPLPKRHVRRGMDYAFTPPPSMMKFDIEVKDDDDFDV